MNKVYVIKMNADFNEGRGPMNFHSVWESGGEAIKYVEKQPGIFGSPQKVELGKYSYYAIANGYEIHEVQVMTTVAMKEAEILKTKKQIALNKLTAEERKILGL